METLSQIEAAEAARLERAWSYERTLDQRDRLRNEIIHLEAQSINLTALEQIAGLVPDVPSDLVVPGTETSPGGDARLLLGNITAGALNIARRRQQKAADRLADAKRELAKCERLLASFEE
jgi:hypothetical protein